MRKNYPDIEKPDCLLLNTQDWPDLYISNTGVLIAHEGYEEHEYRAGDFTNYVDKILRGFVSYKDYPRGGTDETAWKCDSILSEPMLQCFFLAYRKGILQFKDGEVIFDRFTFDHFKARQNKNLVVDGHILTYDGEYTSIDFSTGKTTYRPRYRFEIKVTNPSKKHYNKVLEICSAIQFNKLPQIISYIEAGNHGSNNEDYSKLDYELH